MKSPEILTPRLPWTCWACRLIEAAHSTFRGHHPPTSPSQETMQKPFPLQSIMWHLLRQLCNGKGGSPWTVEGLLDKIWVDIDEQKLEAPPWAFGYREMIWKLDNKWNSIKSWLSGLLCLWIYSVICSSLTKCTTGIDIVDNWCNFHIKSLVCGVKVSWERPHGSLWAPSLLGIDTASWEKK